MNKQLRLLDMPDGSQITIEVTRKPIIKPQFYIRVKAGDGWRFLWKTHTNGGPEWGYDFELTINGGRKKPLLYKTLSGATRMMHEYLYPDAECKVEVWNEPR